MFARIKTSVCCTSWGETWRELSPYSLAKGRLLSPSIWCAHDIDINSHGSDPYIHILVVSSSSVWFIWCGFYSAWNRVYSIPGVWVWHRCKHHKHSPKIQNNRNTLRKRGSPPYNYFGPFSIVVFHNNWRMKSFLDSIVSKRIWWPNQLKLQRPEIQSLCLSQRETEFIYIFIYWCTATVFRLSMCTAPDGIWTIIFIYSIGMVKPGFLQASYIQTLARVKTWCNIMWIRLRSFNTDW